MPWMLGSMSSRGTSIPSWLANEVVLAIDDGASAPGIPAAGPEAPEHPAARAAVPHSSASAAGGSERRIFSLPREKEADCARPAYGEPSRAIRWPVYRTRATFACPANTTLLLERRRKRKSLGEKRVQVSGQRDRLVGGESAEVPFVGLHPQENRRLSRLRVL